MGKGNQEQFLSSSFQYKQQNPSYVGQPLEGTYRNGPVEDRTCTDVFCCLIFLITIGGMIYLAVLGFREGDPSLLASPFDQDGNQCGQDNQYQNHPNIFISSSLANPQQVRFVCVKSCPSSQSATLDCKVSSKVKDCSELKVYASDTIVNLCYPKDIVSQFQFDEYMNVSTIQEYFADLNHGWTLIITIFAASFIISLIFMIFIRYCAGCFVWLFIIGFLLTLAAIGLFFFFIDSTEFLQEMFHYESFPSNLKDRNYQIAIGSVCAFLFVVTFLILICFKKQIQISIGIMKAAADFTKEECSIMLVPFFIVLLEIMFFTFWFASLLFIFSSGERQIEPIEDLPFGWVVWDDTLRYLTIFFLFGLLWVIFFLDGLGCYWISSTAAIWYFEEGQPDRPFIKSVCHSFKASGSIALGSFIIAIVTFIRMVLQFINNNLKQRTLNMSESVTAVKFLLKCAACCIACFERIIRFLTKQAYIMMTISGKNFCSSAKEAFYLMVRSASQYTLTCAITRLFFTLGKLSIVVSSAFLGYVLMIQLDQYRDKIYSPVFLTIIFALVSYPTAAAFMNLFEMASNTILMCYCLESDLAEGANPRCPRAVRNFLRDYVNTSMTDDSEQN